MLKSNTNTWVSSWSCKAVGCRWFEVGIYHTALLPALKYLQLANWFNAQLEQRLIPSHQPPSPPQTSREAGHPLPASLPEALPPP